MKKFLISLVIIKIAAAVTYCFVGFVHPHVIRQVATLAVDQRFVIDWKYHDKNLSWLPRSLAGGDHDGILETEFPLLNYLTVPAFYLPTPQARTAARLLCVLLFLGLWYFNYSIWKNQKILGISCEVPSLILLLLPISGMYFQRFMPDFFSFILCSIALGISLRNPKEIWLPLIFAGLGLLEKPTSIIVFAPLLLLPNPLLQIRQRLAWLIPAGLLMVGYYSYGTKWIRSHSDLDRYYMTDLRNPWQSLTEFFLEPKKVLNLFLRELTAPFLPVMILALWLIRKFPAPSQTSLKLWGIFTLQALVIVMMDGSHSFIHSYYYLGLSMTAALLWQYYFESVTASKLWRYVTILALMIFNFEHIFYELRDLAHPDPQSVESLWQSCQKLKARHPEWPWSQGHSFRSAATPISAEALCFGEIQGSTTSPFGFFYTDQGVPAPCKKIDEDGQVVLAKCDGG